MFGIFRRVGPKKSFVTVSPLGTQILFPPMVFNVWNHPLRLITTDIIPFQGIYLTYSSHMLDFLVKIAIRVGSNDYRLFLLSRCVRYHLNDAVVAMALSIGKGFTYTYSQIFIQTVVEKRKCTPRARSLLLNRIICLFLEFGQIGKAWQIFSERLYRDMLTDDLVKRSGMDFWDALFQPVDLFESKTIESPHSISFISYSDDDETLAHPMLVAWASVMDRGEMFWKLDPALRYLMPPRMYWAHSGRLVLHDQLEEGLFFARLSHRFRITEKSKNFHCFEPSYIHQLCSLMYELEEETGVVKKRGVVWSSNSQKREMIARFCANKDCSRRIKHRKKMKTCKACKSVHYCRRLCQKMDWKRHKLICVYKWVKPLSSAEKVMVECLL